MTNNQNTQSFLINRDTAVVDYIVFHVAIFNSGRERERRQPEFLVSAVSAFVEQVWDFMFLILRTLVFMLMS